MNHRVRVLITGGAGLLGTTLLRTAPAGWEVHGTQRRNPVRGIAAHLVELSDRAAVLRLWEHLRPALVIHTAYSTEGKLDIWEATRNVVEGCGAVGARLIHLSTDALFDGEHGPYAESAEPSPVHDYGEWKARAELLVRERMPQAAVIRTSLLTSFEPLDPRSAWVAGALRRKEPITLYVDELRCPIAPEDLAQQIWEIAALGEGEGAGVWHLAGPEALSRYALGVLIAAHQGLDLAGIAPALSSVSPAPRPRDARLLTARADAVLRTRPRPISALVLGRK